MAILSIPYAATYDSKLMGFEIRVDMTVEISANDENTHGSIHDIDIHEITCLPTLKDYDGIDWTALKGFDPLAQEILAECEDNVDYLVDKALT